MCAAPPRAVPAASSAPTIGCTPAFLAAAQNCIAPNRLASSVTATAGIAGPAGLGQRLDADRALQQREGGADAQVDEVGVGHGGRLLRRERYPRPDAGHKATARTPIHSFLRRLAGRHAAARGATAAAGKAEGRVHARGEVRVVGGDQRGGAGVAHDLEQQREHVLGGVRVEIAGRLVGQDQARAGWPARGRSPPAAARRRTAGPGGGRGAAARPEPLEQRRGARLAPRARLRPAISCGIATFSSAVKSGSRWWNW